MKINVDFSELWAEARKIARSVADFDLDIQPIAFDIDIQLEQGAEISLDDVDFSRGGLASVHGRQVLLYIPDHGERYPDAMLNVEKRRKFHVSWCKTLEDMYSNGRFYRYVATNDISGIFRITGEVYGRKVEGSVELQVCKNCLHKLNYKHARESYTTQSKVMRQFQIVEFFKIYSSFFPHLPNAFQKNRQWGYPDNWSEISNRVRAGAGYFCSRCRVNLSDHKRLLHAHHVNGDKADNRPENLEALCADCHRRQPYHSFVRIKHEDMLQISRLRREQGLIPDGWDEVFDLADPAIHGVLGLERKAGEAPPEIGYDLKDSSGKVVAEIEAAWPKRRLGIVIDESQIPKPSFEGWRFLTVGQCLG